MRFYLSKQSLRARALAGSAFGTSPDRLRLRAVLCRDTFEHELLLVADLLDLDLDQVLACELALQQLLSQRIFDKCLDRPAKRTSTVIGVRALLDEELFG